MAETSICPVCTKPTTPDREAWCSFCDSAFHLNRRADAQEADCGNVWIGEESLSLEFMCNLCLAWLAKGIDEVLELVQAAEAIEVSKEWLATEAAAGRVPHRTTASGAYLFLRRDLPVQGESRP